MKSSFILLLTLFGVNDPNTEIRTRGTGSNVIPDTFFAGLHDKITLTISIRIRNVRLLLQTKIDYWKVHFTTVTLRVIPSHFLRQLPR